jgi:hypothetical protein
VPALAIQPVTRHALLVVLDPSVLADDLPVLVAEIGRALERSRVKRVVCDVGALPPPDLGTVDALARLALALRRAGCAVSLVRASSELRELLGLSGLTRVMPCGGLSVEALGEPEHREEPGRVEEERDPADPAVRDVEDLE